MTLITFSDGKVVLRDGKVGTEQECCCNENCGMCCTDYQNCEITYTAHFSDGSSKTETIVGDISEGPGDTQARFPVLGNNASGFSISIFNDGCRCFAAISVSSYFISGCSHYEPPPIDMVVTDWLNIDAFQLVELDCTECCEVGQSATNCTIKSVVDSGVATTAPSGLGACDCDTCEIQLSGAVTPTAVTIDEIDCGLWECNPLP